MIEMLKACKNCGCESIFPGSPHVELYIFIDKLNRLDIREPYESIRNWYYCTKCNKCCYL